MEVGVSGEQSPMHGRNVPKTPLMITRTRIERAKESFFQVWHTVSFSEILQYGNPAESILHFSLFPCFIINECMLDCQPWAGKHFYPQSILFAWGWYCLVYVSWNLWPVTCDYHVSLLTCQGVQLLVSTSEGKLLRVGDILLARWGRVLPASSARETLDSNQYQT